MTLLVVFSTLEHSFSTRSSMSKCAIVVVILHPVLFIDRVRFVYVWVLSHRSENCKNVINRVNPYAVDG